MAEHVEQQEAGVDLRQLTKTDPDPRVRRRAQAVLLAEEGQTLASVARLFHSSAYRVHVWHERFIRVCPRRTRRAAGSAAWRTAAQTERGRPGVSGSGPRTRTAGVWRTHDRLEHSRPASAA
jgi:hypothetical protein